MKWRSRILRTMFAKGVIDYPVKIAPIDFASACAQCRAPAPKRARCCSGMSARYCRSIRSCKRIAVIGGYADKGVLAGGGSSLVYPVGGNAVPGSQADQLAGTHHVLPVVAAARHPGAGAECRR